MSEEHRKAKLAIEEQERSMQALPLDSRTLMALAADIIERAKAPLAVKVVLGRRVIAHLATDGMAVDHETFLDLKINTVFNSGHSSLWWFHHLRGTGRVLADVKWADPRAVIDMGGGVPLVADGQIVGAIAVSGLAHEDDHALILTAAAGFFRS